MGSSAGEQIGAGSPLARLRDEAFNGLITGIGNMYLAQQRILASLRSRACLRRSSAVKGNQ